MSSRSKPVRAELEPWRAYGSAGSQALIDLGSACYRSNSSSRLARARLVHSPPPQGSGPQSGSSLIPSPFSLTLSSLGLPALVATTRGGTGRAAAPFVTSSPSPLPATSIHQVCPLLLFASELRDEAPQTLTKLFVFGSDSVTLYYLLTSISFAKIIHVYPCPMLGPPLSSTVRFFFAHGTRVSPPLVARFLSILTSSSSLSLQVCQAVPARRPLPTLW
jgi:hypothetical protein